MSSEFQTTERNVAFRARRSVLVRNNSYSLSKDHRNLCRRTQAKSRTRHMRQAKWAQSSWCAQDGHEKHRLHRTRVAECAKMAALQRRGTQMKPNRRAAAMAFCAVRSE